MIEDRSSGGFGLRVKRAIDEGSTVWIKHFKKEYTGVVKFCRPEQNGFMIGVQVDESVAEL